MNAAVVRLVPVEQTGARTMPSGEVLTAGEEHSFAAEGVVRNKKKAE